MKKKYSKALGKLFVQHLDGNTAYVNVGGVNILGSIEERVQLKTKAGDGIWGLDCLVSVQWNSVKIQKLLGDEVRNIEPPIGYDALGKVLDAITKIVNTTFVQACNISCYDVRSFSVTNSDDGEVESVEIVYIDGSVATIRYIKKIKS